MSTRANIPLAADAVGLGLRPEVAADLLLHRDAASFVEIVAETCFANRRARSEARAFARTMPVVVHGVKLSLASTEGIDEVHAQALARLADDVDAPFVAEHLSFSRAGRVRDGVEIGHLTAVPFSRAAVDVIARNVATLRRHVTRPLLLENVASSFRFPPDAHEMDEADFLHAVVRATGCALLLDVGNLRANARNAGVDPFALLSRCPLEHVAAMHVAGSTVEHGFVLDTHAHPIHDEVYALVTDVVARIGPRPILLERDHGFGPFEELRAELRRLHACQGTRTFVAVDRPSSPSSHGSTRPVAGIDITALSTWQRALSHALTDAQPRDDDVRSTALAPAEFMRARELLVRKRVDDALPLLPRVAALGTAVHDAALAAITPVARPARMVAVHDAFRIAHALSSSTTMPPAFPIAAAADLAVLRARFIDAGPGRVARRRVGPWLHVQRDRIGAGVVVTCKVPGGERLVHRIHLRAPTWRALSPGER